MAKQIILVTGGARSGKSKYAEQRAAEFGGRKLYVATAEAKDDEMRLRISEHKKTRSDRWTTVEEPVDLAGVLQAQCGRMDCALVDCLTLWLSNLLLHGGEKHVESKFEELMQMLPELDFDLILVSNEVGSGIVPNNLLARQFRDLAGWANQRVAHVANEVILMVAGMPMIVKKEKVCL
jgi:adenosylcobinamide kinase / adenosylcobinamide-phosphate guanylyltransferase